MLNFASGTHDPVGCTFIITTIIPGVSLYDVWCMGEHDVDVDVYFETVPQRAVSGWLTCDWEEYVVSGFDGREEDDETEQGHEQLPQYRAIYSSLLGKAEAKRLCPETRQQSILAAPRPLQIADPMILVLVLVS
ncbi:hypothetical protein BDW71DRAFT_211037 [Aspergillus fruticulosus]